MNNENNYPNHEISIYETFGGQWIIADAEDEDAPLIKFYNEANTEEFARKVFKWLCEK